MIYNGVIVREHAYLPPGFCGVIGGEYWIATTKISREMLPKPRRPKRCSTRLSKTTGKRAYRRYLCKPFVERIVPFGLKAFAEIFEVKT